MSGGPRKGAKGAVDRLIVHLSKSVDGASLAVFRICFGLLLAYEVGFKFHVDKVKEIYVPDFHFTYHFFSWVSAPGKVGAYALHIAIMLLALSIAAGFMYRVCCALACVLLSYYFFIEKTLYINHTYLYCLLCGIMAFVPAHNMASVDAKYGFFGTKPDWDNRAPRWSLWLLRFQMGVVYAYAGIAKLHDDWLSGHAMAIWLPHRIQQDIVSYETLGKLMSWGGAAFDLGIVPLLLWKRTRIIGFYSALAFHFTNANVFGIASFPWMSLALTLLFFDPDWPREQFKSMATRPAKKRRKLRRMTAPGVALLTSYVVVQLLLPVRPALYPGDSNWTEEGHQFSWHMMLRTKEGSATFLAHLPDGSRETVDSRRWLTERQADRMATKPDLLHQFARFIADEYERQGKGRPKVFVDARVSLNGRPPQPIIHRAVDLAAQPRSLARASWIVPLAD